MLCVISPAKSLASTSLLTLPHAVSSPQFLEKTDELAALLRSKLHPKDYRSLMKVSDEIATRTHKEFQSFESSGSSKNFGSNFTPAGLLFDGPAFKALDLGSLSAVPVSASQKHVRFFSGLYGLLRPCAV